MGLIDRILRVIRSNTNQLVSKAEDPEEVLEQTVAEMQENLVRLRQAVAVAIATQKRTERQASQAESTSTEWYRRAQQALQQGNEALAREALTKRKYYQETVTTLQTQLEQQQSIVGRLKQEMGTLDSKIAEAKNKKDMYIARIRSAQASQKIHEMLGGLDPSNSLRAFERMEDRVLQAEAQSAAIADLSTDELQKQFAALGTGNDIDAELARMKAEIPTGFQEPAQLPADAHDPTKELRIEKQE